MDNEKQPAPAFSPTANYLDHRQHRALNDLSLLTEGLSHMLNAMGESELRISEEEWRNFAMSVSPVLEKAYERADEVLQSLQ
jgi:hypothetical protein